MGALQMGEPCVGNKERRGGNVVNTMKLMGIGMPIDHSSPHFLFLDLIKLEVCIGP